MSRCLSELNTCKRLNKSVSGLGEALPTVTLFAEASEKREEIVLIFKVFSDVHFLSQLRRIPAAHRERFFYSL